MARVVIVAGVVGMRNDGEIDMELGWVWFDEGEGPWYLTVYEIKATYVISR